MRRYLTPQGGCIKNIFRSIHRIYVDITCLKGTTKEGGSLLISIFDYRPIRFDLCAKKIAILIALGLFFNFCFSFTTQAEYLQTMVFQIVRNDQ